MATSDYVEGILIDRPEHLIGPAKIRFTAHSASARQNKLTAHKESVFGAREAAARIADRWHVEPIDDELPAWQAALPPSSVGRSPFFDLAISPKLSDLHDPAERADCVHALACALAGPELHVRSLPLLRWALRPALAKLELDLLFFTNTPKSGLDLPARVAKLDQVRAVYAPHLGPYLAGEHWVRRLASFRNYIGLDSLSLVILPEIGAFDGVHPTDHLGALAWPKILELAAAGWCQIVACDCHKGPAGHEVAQEATELRRLNGDERNLYLG